MVETVVWFLKFFPVVGAFDHLYNGLIRGI